MIFVNYSYIWGKKLCESYWLEGVVLHRNEVVPWALGMAATLSSTVQKTGY